MHYHKNNFQCVCGLLIAREVEMITVDDEFFQSPALCVQTIFVRGRKIMNIN